MYKNDEKGITLIALVITIIILLILAGITMTSILGDNGILAKGNDARRRTEQSGVLEYLRLKIYDKKVEDLEDAYSNIDYLKDRGYIKDEFEENDESCYVIDINEFNPNSATGKGTIESGNIYYLKAGDLYYANSKNETENLGGVYKETVSIADDIFEYADPEKTIIVGIKPEFKEVRYYDKYKGREINIIKDGKTVTEVIIPNRVVKISEYVFDDCINLVKVVIPKNVTEIGRYAFCNCISLIDVEYKGNADNITYGEGVFVHTPIEGNAFTEQTDAKGTYIETDNPYSDNILSVYTKTISGAKEIILEFSDDCMLESSYDFIIIYDKNNNSIYNSHYKGDTILANKRIVVPGDTVRLKFRTDGSVVYRGFRCYISHN